MIEKPRLKDFYHVEILEPDHVFLLTEDRHNVLTGQLYSQLIPLLNGQHTVPEIVGKLSDKINPAQVYFALNRLGKKGYLTDSSNGLPVHEAAYWQQYGATSGYAVSRRRQQQVSLRAIGDVTLAPLLDALAQQGIQVADDGDLQVVVVDDYLRPELAAINQAMLAANKPWLLVKLVGMTPWIGPFFRPGETACWACLEQRLAGNRQVEAYLQQNRESDEPIITSRGALATSQGFAANLAATEIMRWIVTGQMSALSGLIMTWNSKSNEIVRHQVSQRPQCPVCGDPTLALEAGPIELTARPKASRSGAVHQSLTAEEALAKLEHHISPISGVVTWLEDTTEKENGLSYTTVAGHSFPLIQNNLRWLQRNLRSHTGGKGRTLAQAKMSAMGEAIERYASVYRGDEPIVKGSLNSLGDEALDIRSNLHFSPGQYADRWRWNNNLVNPIHLVPNPFDPDLRIDWAPAWSLSANRQRLLPAAYCYFGHPDINNHFFCSSDSNGVAAGSTREEAILQGFMELIERDAVGIWWFNELQRPAVAVDSFDLPYLKALRAHYGELNREFWVLDITNDTGITTFAAVSRRVDEGPEDILVGFGSGLTAEAALMGAVTELNQFLPAVSKLNARGERAYEWPTPDAAQWWREVTVAAKPFLLPDSSAPTRRAEQFANLATTDVRDDIHVCVAQMSRLGLETIVQDLTRPDIELNVCRVVVPGLRHFWRRLGAGRLYDVPVQLGWLPAAKSEAELNEWSLFF